MRATPLLSILLALTEIVNGQTHIKPRYLDSTLCFTPKRSSAYTLFITREGDHWIARASYSDGSPLLDISFKNPQLTIKDGPYKVYYPGKKPCQSGGFIDNRADGLWQSWYSNGQIKDSGLIAENHFWKSWKHWYANGQLRTYHSYILRRDSSSGKNGKPVETPSDKPIVIYIPVTGWVDGPWQSWYENGRPEATGFYQNDTLAGVWHWFRENGQPSSVETYANGKLVDLECYDESGRPTGNTCGIAKPPVLIHPFMDARRYIAYQLKALYNLSKSDVGRLSLQFTVNKKGRMTRLVINSESPQIRSCVYYLLTAAPGWSPAVSHNRAIDYPVSITIY